MKHTQDSNAAPLALITGSARRIGAATVQALHATGYSVVIHYRHSAEAAIRLADQLNATRPGSACTLQADLTDMSQIDPLVDKIRGLGTLSLLVNNASSFYPTPLGSVSQQQWDDLINSNLRAAFFLTQALADDLRHSGGSVVNIIDVHAQRGLPGYPVYGIAKAGLEMMTRTLAKELAPEVRINGVSPGPILWPEDEAALTEDQQQAVLSKTLLGRSGSADDIAQAVLFLAAAPFITGQVLCVDGGRSLCS